MYAVPKGAGGETLEDCRTKILYCRLYTGHWEPLPDGGYENVYVCKYLKL
jgi:hypothetical protein